jgi:hypothetical protein
MFEKNSPALAAVARWVFGFIRFQFQCGQTLNEIQTSLYRAIENGELEKFCDEYHRVNRELEKHKGKTSEQRVEQ